MSRWLGDVYKRQILNCMNLEEDINVSVSRAPTNMDIAIKANITAWVLLLELIALKAPKLIRNGIDITQKHKRVSPSYTLSTAIDARLEAPLIDSLRAR